MRCPYKLLDSQKSFKFFLNQMLWFNLCFSYIFTGLPFYLLAVTIAILIALRLIYYLPYHIGFFNIRWGGLFILLYLLYAVHIICGHGMIPVQKAVRLFFLPFGYLVYLLPLFMFRYARIELLPTLVIFLKKSVKIYAYCLFISLPILIYNYYLGGSEGIAYTRCLFEVWNLYVGGGMIFLLLFTRFLTKKEQIRLHWMIFITLVLSLAFARRGVALTYCSIYMIWFLLQLTYVGIVRKIKYIFMGGICLCAIAYVVLNYAEVLFPQLMDRLTDDTRSGTENELLFDLARTNEFVFGRGIAGTYESEIISDQPDREGIETGYLDVIMRGGIVGLVLFALVVIPSFLLGVFNSKNILSKIFAAIILLFVAYWIMASNNLTFSCRGVIFWWCVLLCYNSKVRKLNNNQILKLVEK